MGRAWVHEVEWPDQQRLQSAHASAQLLNHYHLNQPSAQARTPPATPAAPEATQQTLMTFQSVTFDSNGKMVDTSLEAHVRPNNVVHDSQKANVGIQTRTGGITTFNSHSGPATHRDNSTSVQLRAPTGLVKVGGYEVTPEVVQTLTEAAPELFVPDEEKAAEAAKVAAAAREDAAQAEDLGRHQDDTLEGYHQHLVGEVAPQALIGLMVYGQKGETPPTDLLKTIADQMGEPLDSAIDKVNAVIGGVHRQFTNIAKAVGVDPEKAAVWLREHRKDSSMVVSQAHLLRRDVRGWLPLLEDYQMATGDGRKH
jgi:hypothetical protein